MEDFHLSVAVDDGLALFAIIDGHGGPECAAFFADTLPLLVRNAIRAGNAWGPALSTALEQCGAQWDSLPSSPRTCGCVATAVLVSALDYAVAHVGDCGLMASTDGSAEHRGRMVTRPHHLSDEAEVQRVRAAGGRIEDGRVLGVLKPTRAFGNLDVRALVGGNALISDADVCEGSVELDEHGCGFLVLASDGVWDALDENKVAKVVSSVLGRTSSPSQAAKAVALLAARCALFNRKRSHI